MSTDQNEIAQVLKKEMDQGLGDSLTDENTEAIKSFRSLLKKYQNLVIEYHNHNIESKRYIEMILDKNNRLREINKKLEHENMLVIYVDYTENILPRQHSYTNIVKYDNNLQDIEGED